MNQVRGYRQIEAQHREFQINLSSLALCTRARFSDVKFLLDPMAVLSPHGVDAFVFSVARVTRSACETVAFL